MRKNHVKERLQGGSASLGAWLALPSVAVARLLAHAGFDWLVIDMEHSPLDPGLMTQMVAAIASGPACAPLVRVPACRAEWFKWALDAGAWGVVVPMVGTHADAAAAVQAVRYPPQGARSIGGAFAPYSFGLRNQQEYLAIANEEILLIVQIESTEALANLDAIFSVPGIDVAFVGPYDLHMQLGLPPSGEGSESTFVAALDAVKAAAARHRLPLGIYSSSGAAAAARLREGFQLVGITSDRSFLLAAAREHLAQARTPDTPANADPA